MTIKTLPDRQKAYEKAYDLEILRRLPVIIRVDGKNFHKLTRKLKRPYDSALLNLMANTMLAVARQMDGCIFAYQQSDEISFVLRNDQSLNTEPWFGNRIQKLISISASMVTLEFYKHIYELSRPPELHGDALFDARVFAVPSIHEAVNYLIYRQGDGIKNAISSASRAELRKRHGTKGAMRILHNKNSQKRIEILLNECNVIFEEDYPNAFKHGVGVYKIPVLIDTHDEQTTRLQWTLDTELPRFVEDKKFISSILTNGNDIFRANRMAQHESIIED